LKKLGCLFEAFVGALFHDYNKMGIKDEEGWFNNFFCSGPGFQMAQKFIENVFKKHVNWIELIQNDDNYKNILQVKIQKEFKVTPHYVEIEHDVDEGFKMGVYLCLGQQIHTVKHSDAINITEIKTFKAIQEHYAKHGKIFVFMGEGQHKIKRKAEQSACMSAIEFIKLNNDININANSSNDAGQDTSSDSDN
jgi:dsRNA-specific ribonuclease